MIGGPVVLRDQGNGPAAEMVRALERSPVTGDAVDPRACVALAGLHTEAWVRRAEDELRARFGEGADARLLDRAPQPDLLVAYAFLSKAWAFRTPLIRAHGQIRVRGALVESFGLWESSSSIELYEARAAEVLVHDHRFGSDDEPDDWPSEEFLVELVTEDPDDRIFVAPPAAAADQRRRRDRRLGDGEGARRRLRRSGGAGSKREELRGAVHRLLTARAATTSSTGSAIAGPGLDVARRSARCSMRVRARGSTRGVRSSSRSRGWAASACRRGR